MGVTQDQTGWWKEFLTEDVSSDTFSEEQNALFERYGVTQDQQRLFYSIKTGKNLFLSDGISNEEIVWNIGVMGVNNAPRGDMRYYRKSVVERLKKFDDAEGRYQWRSGSWTESSMRQLIEIWSMGQLVVDPSIATSDGSPMQFVHEWYEHWPPREDQTEEFFEQNVKVYVLLARSICKAYPAATMKGIVSFADMHDFDWDKYDMNQKIRHADMQAMIPNKLRRMISVRPDDKMKTFYEEYKSVMKKYGCAAYDTYEEAVTAEVKLLPSELPTFVGGTRQVDIRECLRHLFRREPEALQLMEEVYDKMEEKGAILHPEHMQQQS